MEEKVLQAQRQAMIAKVTIPKPKALVGGSEVYQKDGLPYWYCRIKGGRDEFMHLYMEDLSLNDLFYDPKAGRKCTFITSKQKDFKQNVWTAIENKPKEGFRWIPVYEPSFELTKYDWRSPYILPEGELKFVAGKEPFMGLTNCPGWDTMLKNYSPENESGMASTTTYFLLLLRWLKDGIATLEQLTHHSEEIGHYKDSENVKNRFETTGEREFGGLYGFAGNTFKIVKDSESEFGYSLLGGTFRNKGCHHPLSDGGWIPKWATGAYIYNSVGLMELQK